MSSDELNTLLAQLQHIVPYLQDIRPLLAQNRDQLKRYAHVAELAESGYQNQQVLESILREAITELSEQLTDIENYILAIATNTQTSRRATQTIDRIQTRHDKRQLHELLQQERDNLQAYQLKIAQQGGDISAELRLLRQRDRATEAIERIEQELDELGD
jgi:hypothetical protein